MELEALRTFVDLGTDDCPVVVDITRLVTMIPNNSGGTQITLNTDSKVLVVDSPEHISVVKERILELFC